MRVKTKKSFKIFKPKSYFFKIRGAATQGENIADNGGIKESFRVSDAFIFIQGQNNI